MFTLNHRTIWTITTAAIMGGIYGFVSATRLNADRVTMWDVAIPVIAGAALSTIIVSALSRMYTMWLLMRESKNHAADKTLCYRGLRISPHGASTSSSTDHHNAPVNGVLCYRGTIAKITTANCEIENEPVEVTLCYRGIRYVKTLAVKKQARDLSQTTKMRPRFAGHLATPKRTLNLKRI